MISGFRATCLLSAFLSLGLCGELQAQAIRGPIISQGTALRYGLEREWFTQVELDRSRSRVQHIFQSRDTLFVQTDRGVIHALDAETGRTEWRRGVGNPDYPSLGSAANDKVLAVVNGSTLYVIDRNSGRQLWDRSLGTVPGAGPAVTAERVFVPMVNGRIESYEIEDQYGPPWMYWSDGRAMVQPITSKQSVAWPTSQGYFYVGRAVNPIIRFRVETDDEIISQPAYGKPYFYAGSMDGYVYAVHEQSGNQRWRFSTGDPISSSPVVIDDRVYVATDRGGMYCIDSQSGDEIWWAPRVERFLSASPTRIFGADRFGRIFILDAKTGGRLGILQTAGINLYHINHRSDRIYLGSDTGILQCLHDVDLDQPVYHNLSNDTDEVEDEAKAGAVAEAPEKKEQPAPLDPDNPFAAGGGGEKPQEDDNPFGGGNDDPFGGAGGGDDNPFN